MNKKNVLAIALVAMTAWIGKPAMAAPGNDAFDPVEYAMPLMGTQSSFELSTGKHLSRHCPSLGDELLDSPDRKDGRRMAVCIYRK